MPCDPHPNPRKGGVPRGAALTPLLLGSCQHALAGAGDALDRGEPVGQLALGRLDEDMLDPDRFIALEPGAQLPGIPAVPAIAQ